VQEFNRLAFAFLGALPQFGESQNTLAEWMNGKAEEVNQNAQSGLNSKIKAKEWATSTDIVEDDLKGARGYALDSKNSEIASSINAQRAESAVAALPDGTIDDSIIAQNMAWSSQKINAELGNIGAILDNINGVAA